jgi:hypothetical protein
MNKRILIFLLLALLLFGLSVFAIESQQTKATNDISPNQTANLPLGWYFKPDKPDTAPSGMPDFDQYQNALWGGGYCGPTAVGNCLWWFGVELKLGYTPPQLIDTLAHYFQTDPNMGTDVHLMETGLDAFFTNYNLPYYETTFQMPNFSEMEDSLKKCQDIILLLGFWFEDPVGSGIWYRCGGHFVTMAGVCSESLKVALSDPARDAAENGLIGRVRPVHLPHPNDHVLHNNPAYVSQDMYNSSLQSPSPGNPGWDLADYPAYADPRFPYDFCYKNIPPEFQLITRMYPGGRPWFAEVEYAVMICPKPIADTCWYFKPDKPDTASSGMPDFDQYQMPGMGFCGPTAVANCLWWFGAVPQEAVDPHVLIDILAGYFKTDPDSGTFVDSMQIGLEKYFQDYQFAYCETTYKMPNFHEMEDSLKKCQDIILLLGFWWQDPTGMWWRCGGHFVTMAGVCSESLKIAISDPARDMAESGWPGRVRGPHMPPHDPMTHNNPANISHDIYQSDTLSLTPGNPNWWLVDYAAANPNMIYDFCFQNVPPEFLPVTKQYQTGRPWVAEVEYAVMICPCKPDTDFGIDATPDTQTVIQGNSTTYTVTVTSIFGFSSPVTLTVAGLPAGATATFVPNPVTPTGSSIMTVNTATTTPIGTYTLIITGNGGGKTHSTNVVLIVNPAPVNCWYWKADNQYAPSGMPDFDQWQMQTPYYCGPTAAANCLWWFGVGNQLGYTPPQFIDTLSVYFQTNHLNPPFGTDVFLMEKGLENFWSSKGIYTLYEKTYKMPDFHEMEESLKVSQDIILLLGFWWWDGMNWWRCGGHYVTMAGVCSESLKIAISDPGRDAAENGWPGRVRGPHMPPHSPITHNNPASVSHDIYNSILQSPTPGNPFWALIDYPNYPDPRFPYEYCWQNVPPEFLPQTQPYPGQALWFAEVEYAVMICPKPDCRLGDVNQDGIIDIGDIVLLINYVFYNGIAPVPDLSCGDVNCDGIVDIGDIVYLINYVFYGGTEPPWWC